MPEYRAPELAGAPLEDASPYDTLRQLSGATIYRAPRPRPPHSIADPALAKLLNTTVGAAILVGEGVGYTAEGVPVLIGVNKCRGDAYRFLADLFRRT